MPCFSDHMKKLLTQRHYKFHENSKFYELTSWECRLQIPHRYECGGRWRENQGKLKPFSNKCHPSIELSPPNVVRWHPKWLSPPCKCHSNHRIQTPKVWFYSCLNWYASMVNIRSWSMWPGSKIEPVLQIHVKHNNCTNKQPMALQALTT